MITCKEDLMNTYIENDQGELREAYFSLIEELEVPVSIDGEYRGTFIAVLPSCNVVQSISTSIHTLRRCKKLTMSDLKPKLRTKTVYEKVDLHINEIAKRMVDGEEFYNHDGSDWFDWKFNGFRKNGLALTGLNGFDFYRRVEVEVDWRDEVSDFVINNKITYSCNGHRHIIAMADYTDEQFLEMCRVTLRATGELE